MVDNNNVKYYTDKNKLAPDYMFNSYSGVDIMAELIVQGEDKPLTLGELQTISYSIHRENKPVRTIGRASAHGFVKGPRTIAGSMIFTVFNSYAFYRLKQYKDLVYGTGTNKKLYPLADMLPPFDICFTYANEYGSFSRMRIYGVTIIDEGGTMSVDDLITEQTYTYMARGIQPITAYVPESWSAWPDNGSKEIAKKRNTIGILTPEVMIP